MAWGGEPPAWSESPGSNPVSQWYNVEPVNPIKDQGSWQNLINRRDTSSRQTSLTRIMGSTSTTGWTIILQTILISGQAQGEQLILQMFLTFGLFQVHQLQNNSRDINLHGGIEKVVIIFPNINIPCQTHVVHRWSWNMSYGTHGTLTPIVQNQRWTTRCQIENWKLQVDNNVSIPETWADFSHRNIQASQAARSESISIIQIKRIVLHAKSKSKITRCEVWIYLDHMQTKKELHTEFFSW